MKNKGRLKKEHKIIKIILGGKNCGYFIGVEAQRDARYLRSLLSPIQK